MTRAAASKWISLGRACEILGLPARFRQASSTITGKVPGESDHRATETERILQKIRKLLALTNSSNEHEALVPSLIGNTNVDMKELTSELKAIGNTRVRTLDTSPGKRTIKHYSFRVLRDRSVTQQFIAVLNPPPSLLRL